MVCLGLWQSSLAAMKFEGWTLGMYVSNHLAFSETTLFREPLET